MTNTQKMAVEWAKLPAALVALGVVLMFLGDAKFATDAELAAQEVRVAALEATAARIEVKLGAIGAQVDLMTCLHLADVRGESWEPCVAEFGR